MKLPKISRPPLRHAAAGAGNLCAFQNAKIFQPYISFVGELLNGSSACARPATPGTSWHLRQRFFLDEASPIPACFRWMLGNPAMNLRRLPEQPTKTDTSWRSRQRVPAERFFAHSGNSSRTFQNSGIQKRHWGTPL